MSQTFDDMNPFPHVVANRVLVDSDRITVEASIVSNDGNGSYWLDMEDLSKYVKIYFLLVHSEQAPELSGILENPGSRMAKLSNSLFRTKVDRTTFTGADHPGFALQKLTDPHWPPDRAAEDRWFHYEDRADGRPVVHYYRVTDYASSLGVVSAKVISLSEIVNTDSEDANIIFKTTPVPDSENAHPAHAGHASMRFDVNFTTDDFPGGAPNIFEWLRSPNSALRVLENEYIERHRGGVVNTYRTTWDREMMTPGLSLIAFSHLDLHTLRDEEGITGDELIASDGESDILTLGGNMFYKALFRFQSRPGQREPRPVAVNKGKYFFHEGRPYSGPAFYWNSNRVWRWNQGPRIRTVYYLSEEHRGEGLPPDEIIISGPHRETDEGGIPPAPPNSVSRFTLSENDPENPGEYRSVPTPRGWYIGSGPPTGYRSVIGDERPPTQWARLEVREVSQPGRVLVLGSHDDSRFNSGYYGADSIYLQEGDEALEEQDMRSAPIVPSRLRRLHELGSLTREDINRRMRDWVTNRYKKSSLNFLMDKDEWIDIPDGQEVLEGDPNLPRVSFADEYYSNLSDAEEVMGCHNVYFSFDYIRAISDNSRLGFLLENVISSTVSRHPHAMGTEGDFFINRCLQNSKILSMEVTRRQLSNNPSSNNPAGTPSYGHRNPDESDRYIISGADTTRVRGLNTNAWRDYDWASYAATVVFSDGRDFADMQAAENERIRPGGSMWHVLGQPWRRFRSSPHRDNDNALESTLEEVQLAGFSEADPDIMNSQGDRGYSRILARSFVLRDYELFRDHSHGKYTYFLDLKIRDGIKKTLSQFLEAYKQRVEVFKIILARARIPVRRPSYNGRVDWKYYNWHQQQLREELLADALQGRRELGSYDYEAKRFTGQFSRWYHREVVTVGGFSSTPANAILDLMGMTVYLWRIMNASPLSAPDAGLQPDEQLELPVQLEQLLSIFITDRQWPDHGLMAGNLDIMEQMEELYQAQIVTLEELLENTNTDKKAPAFYHGQGRGRMHVSRPRSAPVISIKADIDLVVDAFRPGEIMVDANPGQAMVVQRLVSAAQRGGAPGVQEYEIVGSGNNNIPPAGFLSILSGRRVNLISGNDALNSAGITRGETLLNAFLSYQDSMKESDNYSHTSGHIEPSTSRSFYRLLGSIPGTSVGRLDSSIGLYSPRAVRVGNVATVNDSEKTNNTTTVIPDNLFESLIASTYDKTEKIKFFENLKNESLEVSKTMGLLQDSWDSLVAILGSVSSYKAYTPSEESLKGAKPRVPMGSKPVSPFSKYSMSIKIKETPFKTAADVDSGYSIMPFDESKIVKTKTIGPQPVRMVRSFLSDSSGQYSARMVNNIRFVRV